MSCAVVLRSAKNRIISLSLSLLALKLYIFDFDFVLLLHILFSLVSHFSIFQFHPIFTSLHTTLSIYDRLFLCAAKSLAFQINEKYRPNEPSELMFRLSFSVSLVNCIK